MNEDLPEFYFRIRENGAIVFRISSDVRQRRIEMNQIAIVNIKNGDIKPHGDHKISKEELSHIKDWMDNRTKVLAKRDIDDIHRAVDHMNLTTQWAQSRASTEQLEEVTDTLLMAMHDLRTVLIRKKADRILKKRGD